MQGWIFCHVASLVLPFSRKLNFWNRSTNKKVKRGACRKFLTVGQYIHPWTIHSGQNDHFLAHNKFQILFKFGLKKVDFLKFWRLFWWFFRFWRQIFHIFFYFRVLWTRKLKFLNFKTHENLFLRQKFCVFFMSPKWSIFPTVRWWESAFTLLLHWLD